MCYSYYAKNIFWRSFIMGSVVLGGAFYAVAVVVFGLVMAE